MGGGVNHEPQGAVHRCCRLPHQAQQPGHRRRQPQQANGKGQDAYALARFAVRLGCLVDDLPERQCLRPANPGRHKGLKEAGGF